MTVIIIEGPEKAGKSTLARALQAAFSRLSTKKVLVRHWVGRAVPDDRVYARRLEGDASARVTELLAIWDRGWPSEYVYGQLLGQDRRLAGDPWLGEWLHGRAVQANGLRVMLTGPSAAELARRRTPDDLRVSPADEQRLYTNYALRYGWTLVEDAPVEVMARRVVQQFHSALTSADVIPPVYCGNPAAETVVVGEDRDARMVPGGWLPFSSRLTTEFGRLLGDRAFEFGWTNAHDCPPEALRRAKVLVPCGHKAALWVRNYVTQEGAGQQVIQVPHPSHAFRYNNPVAGAERVVARRAASALIANQTSRQADKE